MDNIMKKYKVIYSIAIEVNADDEEQAHEYADEELEYMVKDEEATGHYYLKTELYNIPRQIVEII